MAKTGKSGILIWILFLIIFINGFESGGYQASLFEIGQEYNLSKTSMGLYAAMELTATMLAPIILGRWADRTGKQNSIAVLLGVQAVSAVLVSFLSSHTWFLASIFVVGLTTSALQFIAIAAVGDCYPVSGERKIGYITSLYALGAFVAPMLVRWYLRYGVSWRILFVLIAVTTFVAFTGVLAVPFEQKEERQRAAGGGVGDPGDVLSSGAPREHSDRRKIVYLGVAMLCVIMCVYVGFENGFTFFVDAYMQDELQVDAGKIAIAIFWMVMIPARIVVGRYAKYAKEILLGSCIVIPMLTLFIAFATSPARILALSIPLGIASGAIYPCVLNMSFKYSGMKTATVTGAITAATGLGAVIFTTLTGIISDARGIRIGIAALAGCFIFSLLAIGTIDRMDRKH